MKVTWYPPALLSFLIVSVPFRGFFNLKAFKAGALSTAALLVSVPFRGFFNLKAMAMIDGVADSL